MHTAGVAGLGLTGRIGLATPQGPIAMLVKMLEDSPREQIPQTLVRMIREGLRYEDALAALSLAAVRNVQPYPDVGFKYHAVMMLRSVDTTTQHLPSAQRWLPIVWAAGYFKDAQADERASSGWRMPTRPAAPGASPQAARQALVAALERWDLAAADAATTAYAQSAPPGDLFALLFACGARDLRDIGHKAITVCNAHHLVTLFGAGPVSEDILRSTVAALLNREGEPDPATHDLAPDRPWRENRERLPQIPPSWRQGRDDPGARAELRAALYRVSAEESGRVVVEMLQRGISPQALWQVLFDTAAELLVHRPGIVPVHATTTANALHYAYRSSGDEQMQQLALLQCAAFIAMFRQITHTAETAVNLQTLEPLALEHAGDPLEEIFSDVASGQRGAAMRKSLGYLRSGGDADRLIARARHHLVYGAREAHDYKLAEALFDNLAQLPDPLWRSRYLSAGIAYFKAPTPQPVPIVAETLKLLES